LISPAFSFKALTAGSYAQVTLPRIKVSTPDFASSSRFDSLSEAGPLFSILKARSLPLFSSTNRPIYPSHNISVSFLRESSSFKNGISIPAALKNGTIYFLRYLDFKSFCVLTNISFFRSYEVSGSSLNPRICLYSNASNSFLSKAALSKSSLSLEAEKSLICLVNRAISRFVSLLPYRLTNILANSNRERGIKSPLVIAYMASVHICGSYSRTSWAWASLTPWTKPCQINRTARTAALVRSYISLPSGVCRRNNHIHFSVTPAFNSICRKRRSPVLRLK